METPGSVPRSPHVHKSQQIPQTAPQSNLINTTHPPTIPATDNPIIINNSTNNDTNFMSMNQSLEDNLDDDDDDIEEQFLLTRGPTALFNDDGDEDDEEEDGEILPSDYSQHPTNNTMNTSTGAFSDFDQIMSAQGSRGSQRSTRSGRRGNSFASTICDDLTPTQFRKILYAGAGCFTVIIILIIVIALQYVTVGTEYQQNPMKSSNPNFLVWMEELQSQTPPPIGFANMNSFQPPYITDFSNKMYIAEHIKDNDNEYYNIDNIKTTIHNVNLPPNKSSFPHFTQNINTKANINDNNNNNQHNNQIPFDPTSTFFPILGDFGGAPLSFWHFFDYQHNDINNQHNPPYLDKARYLEKVKHDVNINGGKNGFAHHPKDRQYEMSQLLQEFVNILPAATSAVIAPGDMVYNDGMISWIDVYAYKNDNVSVHAHGQINNNNNHEDQHNHHHHNHNHGNDWNAEYDDLSQQHGEKFNPVFNKMYDTFYNFSTTTTPISKNNHSPHIPWLLALGNHDMRSTALPFFSQLTTPQYTSEQLKAQNSNNNNHKKTTQSSSITKLPYPFYEYVFNTPSPTNIKSDNIPAGKLSFLIIDTNLLQCADPYSSIIAPAQTNYNQILNDVRQRYGLSPIATNQPINKQNPQQQKQQKQHDKMLNNNNKKNKKNKNEDLQPFDVIIPRHYESRECDANIPSITEIAMNTLFATVTSQIENTQIETTPGTHENHSYRPFLEMITPFWLQHDQLFDYIQSDSILQQMTTSPSSSSSSSSSTTNTTPQDIHKTHAQAAAQSLFSYTTQWAGLFFQQLNAAIKRVQRRIPRNKAAIAKTLVFLRDVADVDNLQGVLHPQNDEKVYSNNIANNILTGFYQQNDYLYDVYPDDVMKHTQSHSHPGQSSDNIHHIDDKIADILLKKQNQNIEDYEYKINTIPNMINNYLYYGGTSPYHSDNDGSNSDLYDYYVAKLERTADTLEIIQHEQYNNDNNIEVINERLRQRNMRRKGKGVYNEAIIDIGSVLNGFEYAQYDPTRQEAPKSIDYREFGWVIDKRLSSFMNNDINNNKKNNKNNKQDVSSSQQQEQQSSQPPVEANILYYIGLLSPTPHSFILWANDLYYTMTSTRSAQNTNPKSPNYRRAATDYSTHRTSNSDNNNNNEPRIIKDYFVDYDEYQQVLYATTDLQQFALLLTEVLEQITEKYDYTNLAILSNKSQFEQNNNNNQNKKTQSSINQQKEDICNYEEHMFFYESIATPLHIQQITWENVFEYLLIDIDLWQTKEHGHHHHGGGHNVDEDDENEKDHKHHKDDKHYQKYHSSTTTTKHKDINKILTYKNNLQLFSFLPPKLSFLIRIFSREQHITWFNKKYTSLIMQSKEGNNNDNNINNNNNKVIIVGHHSLSTISRHQTPISLLTSYLSSLYLPNNNKPIYISGHDHILGKYKITSPSKQKQEINVITSGGGGLQSNWLMSYQNVMDVKYPIYIVFYNDKVYKQYYSSHPSSSSKIKKNEKSILMSQNPVINNSGNNDKNDEDDYHIIDGQKNKNKQNQKSASKISPILDFFIHSHGEDDNDRRGIKAQPLYDVIYYQYSYDTILDLNQQQKQKNENNDNEHQEEQKETSIPPYLIFPSFSPTRRVFTNTNDINSLSSPPSKRNNNQDGPILQYQYNCNTKHIEDKYGDVLPYVIDHYEQYLLQQHIINSKALTTTHKDQQQQASSFLPKARAEMISPINGFAVLQVFAPDSSIVINKEKRNNNKKNDQSQSQATNTNIAIHYISSTGEVFYSAWLD